MKLKVTVLGLFLVTFLLYACTGRQSPTFVTPESTTPIAPTPPVASPDSQSGDIEMPIETPAGKTGLPNLSPVLNQLFADWPTGPGMEQAIERGVEIENDRVKVMLIMQDEASADSAVTALPTLGGEVIAHYESWIDAWVPVASLDRIARLPGVSLVREPVQVLPLN